MTVLFRDVSDSVAVSLKNFLIRDDIQIDPFIYVCL